MQGTVHTRRKLTIMQPVENSDPNFWREVAWACSFPGIMFAYAIIPVLNFTYSGHGGISWFAVPLCFPYVLLRAIVTIAKGAAESRRWFWNFFRNTIPCYIALALPLSWASTASIGATFGLRVSPWKFFAVMVTPFPWFYFT
jgi:hypothetical protein